MMLNRVAAVLAEGNTEGLADSASPTLLFFGGLGLVLVGILLLVGAKKLGENSDAGSFMSPAGWILGIIGVVGVLTGLFGTDLWS